MDARMRGMVVGGIAAVAIAAGAAAIGQWMAMAGRMPQVAAMTSQSDDAFAVCTVPLDPTLEAFFILDFETGDLSGGALNPATSQFSAAFKHNVLKDLGFKPGQAKNPKFLLVSGVAEVRRGNNTFASSVLYVTDSSTGTTAAYGIPWSVQQPAMSGLVLIDVARPRGGGRVK